MALDISTLYIPTASPPTPAPSPRPSSFNLSPNIISTRHTFSSLQPFDRRQLLSVILSDCTPDELLYITSTIAPRMRRDFLRELPPELAIYVLSFVEDPRSLLRAARVSQYWNGLVSDEWLWKHMCETHGFELEEEWGKLEAQHDHGSESDSSSTTANKHRARHSTGSVPTLSELSPRRFPYRTHFKTSYMILTNWRRGGTLLRRFPLASHPQHLPNDAVQPPLANSSTTAVPTSVALDSDWIVVGLANSRIHIFSARTGVSCRTLVGHTQGVWAVALVKGGGHPINVSETINIDDVDYNNELLSSTSSKHTRPRNANEPPIAPIAAEGLDHLIQPTLRTALGLDGVPRKHFRRRSTSGIFPETSSNTSKPTPSTPKKSYRPSNPSGTSDGWGQPNALVVSGGCDKDLRVWDVKSGYCIYRLPGHTSTIRCLKVLHNRPIAVSGSRDRTLRVWDIQRGRLLRVLSGHVDSVRSLDVCGNRVVSGSYDQTARVWDVDTGECLHVLRGHFHQIYSVAFDGVRIASGSMDTTVRVWDAETGACLALLQAHAALVCQLQLSPTMLVTGGSDGRVITFSLPFNFASSSPPPPSQEPSTPPKVFPVIQRLSAHDSSVTGLQLDSRFLVTGGNDGRVRLFELTPDIVANKGERCEYVREMCEPSEGVWKVACTRETCVVMSKKADKTWVEIWTFKPQEEG